MKRHKAMTPESDVRGTPWELFNQLNAKYHFDLDACATHANTKCRVYFTERGLHEKKADGRVVQISGPDGTTRQLLDLEGNPLAERLRTFQSTSQAQAALLAGASFDVPLDSRGYPRRDVGVSQMRYSELCRADASVFGLSERQHAGLLKEGPFEGTLYARSQANNTLDEKTQGGLSGSWFRKKVFVNPPYSEIEKWLSKAWNSDAALVYLLVPATRTEQPWWQLLVEPWRDRPDTRLTTHFLPGRYKFVDENNQPILSKSGKPQQPMFGLVGLLLEQK